MTIRHRLDAGWPIQRALSTPVGESSSSFNMAKRMEELKAQQDRIESKLDELISKLNESL